MTFICGQFSASMYPMTKDVCMLGHREGSPHGLDGPKSVCVTGGPSSRLPFQVSC